MFAATLVSCCLPNCCINRTEQMISSNEKNGKTHAIEDCAYDSNHRLTQPHRGEVVFLFFFINKKMLNNVHTANV